MNVAFPKIGIEIYVPRVAFYVTKNFPIYWYSICIAAGFVLALIYAWKKSRSYNLNFDKFIDVVLVSGIAAVVGARLYYVIPKFNEFYKNHFLEIFNLRSGGLAIYGAIIGAFISAYIMCRVKKLSVRAVFDIGAMGFLIGQGIGRWGNFFNQEAFGINTNLPWGMKSNETIRFLEESRETLAAAGINVNPQTPVHPTFLYEFLWCAAGFILLSIFMKRRSFDGQIFLSYGVWYGTGRFFIESLRTDSLMAFGGNVRLSQAVSVVVVIACLVLLYVFKNKYAQKEQGDPPPLEKETEEGNLPEEAEKTATDGSETDKSVEPDEPVQEEENKDEKEEPANQDDNTKEADEQNPEDDE